MRYTLVLVAALLAACGGGGDGGGGGGSGGDSGEVTGRPVLGARSVVLHMEPVGAIDRIEGLPGAAAGAEQIEVLTDAGFGEVIDIALVEADGSFRDLSIGDNAHDQIWLVAENEHGRSEPLRLLNDIEPPVVTMTGGPAETTTETTADFEVGCTEDPCSYLCALDRGEFSPCTPPIRLDDLAPGAHQFQAKAIDAAGNSSDAKTHGWNVVEP